MKHICIFSSIVFLFGGLCATYADKLECPKGYLVSSGGRLTERGIRDLDRLNKEIPTLRKSGKDREMLTADLNSRAGLELSKEGGVKQIDFAKQDMDEAVEHLELLHPKFSYTNDQSYDSASYAIPTSFAPENLLNTFERIAKSYEKLGKLDQADRAYQKAIDFVVVWNKSHQDMPIRELRLTNACNEYAKFLDKIGRKVKAAQVRKKPSIK